jgi:glycerophosphoryl diester phosphodiesterase
VLIVSAHNGYPRHLSSGADFIEVDIRRTREGVVVISHDELEGDRRYVSFDEVLDAVCGNIGLQLDLKEHGYEVELITRALEKCTEDQLVVTTHNSESLRGIKARFPDLRTGLTREHPEQTDADFICLDQKYVTNESLSFCEQHELDVWVWTVDDRRLMERLIRGGRIKGIITNRPDQALKLRSARS